MAYAGAMTLENLGDGDWQINIVETELGNTDEPDGPDNNPGIEVPFEKYRIIRVVSEKSAGSAATLQPTVGRSADPATTVEFLATAAEPVDEQPIVPVQARVGANSRIHWRSVADAGNDNTVNSFMRIRQGWGDE